MTEHDRKIESILNSITQGYEKLERIESDLEEVRRKKGEIIFQNDITCGDKEKWALEIQSQIMIGRYPIKIVRHIILIFWKNLDVILILQSDIV